MTTTEDIHQIAEAELKFPYFPYVVCWHEQDPEKMPITSYYRYSEDGTYEYFNFDGGPYDMKNVLTRRRGRTQDDYFAKSALTSDFQPAKETDLIAHLKRYAALK